MTQEDKRDIVVYSTDNEEILPLSIQNENGGSIEQHNGSMDKVDVNQIIRTVVVEGNLSPTQVEMLRVKVSKTKKQGGKIM